MEWPTTATSGSTGTGCPRSGSETMPLLETVNTKPNTQGTSPFDQGTVARLCSRRTSSTVRPSRNTGLVDITGDQGQIPTHIGSVASCGQRVTRRCTDCSELIPTRIGSTAKKTIAAAKQTRVRLVADRVDSGWRLA